MGPSISVVIPTYKGKSLLAQNLPSVFHALEQATDTFEIIVVDDASQDDTATFLKEQYPSITFLCNESNKGFSPTINKGIFAAQYEWVLLLNNDVKLLPNYFNALIPHLENKNCFGIMGKIIGYDNDQLQDSSKYPNCSLLNINGTTNYQFINEANRSTIYTFMLSGANALVNREKLLQLQGFCELYAPFYWEDVDLSIRAWKMGWQCLYEPNAICRHPASTTVKSNFKKKQTAIISNRNKLLLHSIHLSSTALILYHFKLFGKALFALLRFNFSFLKSCYLYIQLLPEALKTRSTLKALQAANNQKHTLSDIYRFIKKDIGTEAITLF
jgi:GT2 family glycosyltransferase